MTKFGRSTLRSPSSPAHPSPLDPLQAVCYCQLRVAQARNRMPKQRRATGRRSSGNKQKPTSVTRSTPAAVERTPAIKETPRQQEPAPQPPRRPAFYEALTLYESGVRALQRHDFSAGATSFREVVQRYPDEREVVERARLYLQVCERETARRPAGPQTPTEWVYAATVALNAGNAETALNHLRRALELDPDSDHAHYIMAVALAEHGDSDDALEHLRQAIAINPENRSTARQDPDLSALRELAAFRDALGTSSIASRRRPRPRR
jgi:tetratricopeptide (TPR) repeat protein